MLIGLLYFGLGAGAQGTLKGIITTSDKLPAEQVNIQLKNYRLTLVSDDHGNFEFKNLPAGNYTVVASFAGLITQETNVEVKDNGAAYVELVLVENLKKLEEVIVTSKKGFNTQVVSAGKISINPMDLPQSVVVINQELMRDQQVQRLSDVIKNVNGVYLGTTRGNVQESFYARGYSFSSTNMFKNGARVNNAVMPEMSSLEQVEILKGSAAILYGNVAPGGIINMVTKQPKFKFGGEVSLRAGSYGLIKPAVDVYGPISKNIAYRLNATYEKSESFREVVTSNRKYVNPSLLFKLGKKTELLVQGDYLDADFTPDFGIGSLDNTRIPDVPRSSYFGSAWQYNKARQTTTTISLKHSITNNWSINGTASFQQYKRDYYSTERIQAAANGDWTRPLNKILSQEDYILGSVDLTGKFSTGKVGHQLLTGIDGDHYYTSTYAFNNPTTYDKINILDPTKFTPRADIPTAARVKKVETPIYRMGAYVQDLISLSPKFKLLAGVRWSQQESRRATTTYLLKDSIVKGIAKTDAAFSPRAGLVFKATSKTSVFASYANSFTVNSGTDVFGNALDASIIDQYELGVKNQWLNGRLSANLTLYRIINNNLAQTAPFAGDGITVNNNTALKELTGQTTSDGFEADISSQPIKGLNINAGYSYNNMRYTKVENKVGNYVEGQRLVNSPAHTANASAFYTVRQGILAGLKAGATAVYIGDRLGGWNDTQGQPQTFSRLIPVDGFTTIDFSVGYSFKKISLLAKVSNIFNAYNYYVHENYSINPIPPTQFIATASVKF